MHLRTLTLLVVIGLFYSTSFAHVEKTTTPESQQKSGEEGKVPEVPTKEATSMPPPTPDPALKASVDSLEKEVKSLHEVAGLEKIFCIIGVVTALLTLILLIFVFQKTVGLATGAQVEKTQQQLGPAVGQVQGQVNDLQTNLAQVGANLQTTLATVRSDIQTALTAVRGDVAAARNDVQTALTAARGDVATAKSDIQTTLTAVRGDLTSTKTDIQSTLQAVRAEVAAKKTS